MESNIKRLETALHQINTTKKQLSRNTAEAKSRIQGSISRQLEALRNREVWLLNQLDTVSGAKEEILQQQSARLNKTLGVLQSSLTYPQESGSVSSATLERVDLSDLIPEETPYINFKCEPAKLRSAIMDFGKVVSSAVSPLQSPFLGPGHLAPSLPKHLEEYEDAEHHVLYKTVEEINRSRTEKPCVYVNIPKLSTRIEDWLLYPTSAANCSQPVSSSQGTNLPYNPSDWLTTQRSDGKGLERLSSDASIQNWLYKIKQFPMEEDDDDFEFVDEMSDNKTSSNLEEFPHPHSPAVGENMWLTGHGEGRGTEVTFLFKIPDLPQEMWLLKTDDKPNISPELHLDMSRYFTNISDELDKWLFKGQDDPLTATLEQTITDNPWLMTSRSSTRSRSQSPAFSTTSTTSLKPKKKPNINKWLLSSQPVQSTSSFSCPFMDKYMKEMNDLNWLMAENASFESDAKGVSNPFSSYEKKNPFDLSKWLKQDVVETSFMQEDNNPLSSVLERYKGMPIDQWLLSNGTDDLDTKFKVIDLDDCDGDNGKWLIPPTHFNPSMEIEDFDCGDIL